MFPFKNASFQKETRLNMFHSLLNVKERSNFETQTEVQKKFG